MGVGVDEVHAGKVSFVRRAAAVGGNFQFLRERFKFLCTLQPNELHLHPYESLEASWYSYKFRRKTPT